MTRSSPVGTAPGDPQPAVFAREIVREADATRALTELKVNTVTKPDVDPTEQLTADICVVGAGISGLSAAVEARRLGRSVVLVDALPVLGGQCVTRSSGCSPGFTATGPSSAAHPRDLRPDLRRPWRTDDIAFNVNHTVTVAYDEVCSAGGSRTWSLAGNPGRPRRVGAARRRGAASSAPPRSPPGTGWFGCGPGFVDASGDAALTWEAGLACRIRSAPSGAHSRSGWRTCARSSSRSRRSWPPGSRGRPRSRGWCGGTAWRSSSPAAHGGDEHDAHRGAARGRWGGTGPARGEGPGRPRRGVPAQGVPEGFGDAKVRNYGFPGPPADPVDRRPRTS